MRLGLRVSRIRSLAIARGSARDRRRFSATGVDRDEPTAHTPARDVVRARDCGGHIIVKKPFAPIVMLERIIWVAKEGRPFLFSDNYVGPDRRFRDDRPPNGKGRRREDADAAAAAANETSIDVIDDQKSAAQ